MDLHVHSGSLPGGTSCFIVGRQSTNKLSIFWTEEADSEGHELSLGQVVNHQEVMETRDQ